MSRRARLSRSSFVSLGVSFGLVAIAGLLTAAPAAALEPDGQYLYVPNRASSDVAVIDHATQRLIARIEVGKVPCLGFPVHQDDTTGSIAAITTEGRPVELYCLTATDNGDLAIGSQVFVGATKLQLSEG